MAQTPTPVPVLTWRYDVTHNGQNTNETLLTPSNVKSSNFGKLFAMPVDSTVYAQPLYVPGLRMSDGKVHNVVFVVTSNDSVYAFDADSNSGADASPIWQVSMLTADHGAGAGATAVPYQDTGSRDVEPTVGITGTPVINLARHAMYLVANTKENGVYFSRLHAINIVTGAEQPNSPVDVAATVAGDGAGSSGGQITFSPLWQNQRSALNYYNGYVYFGYAAHGDFNAWHGWLFAYDASTLQQTAVMCLSPHGLGAGVWASGAGMPIDTSIPGGRMFVATGNGSQSVAPPFTPSSDLSESIIAFDIADGKFTPKDIFTAFNYKTLSDYDWDQGSGGPLMLPDQPGAHPHLLITAGKEGRVTLLDRDNLGGLASDAFSNTNAVQDIAPITQAGQGFWSSTAYWNGNVYMWPGGWKVGNVPMLFRLNNGLLDTTPASKGDIVSTPPSPTFSISSHGASNGIAWAVRADQFRTSGPAILYAFDANDLSSPIFESDARPRDSAGLANKFAVPVVTNGKVYFAARNEIDVYGLLHLAFTPPPPGKLSVGQNPGTVKVSIADSDDKVVNPSDATVVLKVTGPNNYSTTYTATTSGGVATFGSLAPLNVAGTYFYTAQDDDDVPTQAVAGESVTWPAPVGNFGVAVDSVTFTNPVGQDHSVKLQGWVADPKDGAPLSNVKVYIDGTSIGTPTLGIDRATIAELYNNEAYFDSGFQMLYPASSLSLGQHEATVTAINSHGRSTTLGPISFTVAGTAGAGWPLGFLNDPVDNITFSSTVGQADSVKVTGWVADPQDGAPLSSVKVYIDGTLIGSPTRGIQRPDIAAAYGNAYLKSGFRMLYPASSLALGAHQLTLIAKDSGGRSRTLGPQTFTVAATAGPGSPFGAIDKAADSLTGTNPVSQSGSLLVAGWVADPEDGAPLVKVRVYVDGNLIGAPTLDLKRADVAAAYSNRCLNSGLRLLYPASSLAVGVHHVTVIATDSSGRVTTLGPRTFTVQ